jgi:hypothetical protein
MNEVDAGRVRETPMASVECQGKEARVRVDLGRGLDDGQMRGVPTSLCLLEFVNKRVGKGEEKMRSEKEKEEE